MDLLSNIVFQGLSLGVVGAFCWMVYSFRRQMVECLKGAFTFGRGRVEPDSGKQSYNAFTAVAMTLGSLSFGLGTVKVLFWLLASGTGTPGTFQWHLAGLSGTSGLSGLPDWVSPAAALVVAAAVIGLVFFESAVLRVVGRVTLSGRFVGVVINTRRNWLSAASIVVVPLVSAWNGVNPVRDGVIAYLFMALMFTLCVLFVVDSLRGFIREKVSVLVWFLYLCGVEIIPIGIVVVAIARMV